MHKKDIGAPEALVVNDSKAENSAEVKRFCMNVGTPLKTLEQGTPWANLVELCVGIIKKLK